MKASTSVIGIDVGGTKIAAGALELPEGRWTRFRTCPTRRDRGGSGILDEVLQISEDLYREIPSASGRPVAAIGIGLCELVGRTGEILSSHAVDWRTLPVLEELGRIAPAVLEADVRAAARAEALLGAGRGLGSFLHVTIGTGISCCLVLEGRPYLGSSGLTGTMASSPLGPLLGIPDSGSSMTLEDLSSGPALVARFRKAGGVAERGEEVLQAAAGGDPTALRILDSAAAALGAHIGLLVNVLDPEAVVIGGGLGLSTGHHWDALTAAIRHQIWSEIHRGLPILRATTGIDAGWLGAAVAAMERFDLPPLSPHLPTDRP